MIENEKAIEIENRLRAIRKEIFFKNEITREELKTIVIELDKIETNCYNYVIKEIDFPYSSVMACLEVTKSFLLMKLTEII